MISKHVSKTVVIFQLKQSSGKVAALIAVLGILDNQRIYIASLFFSCLQLIELQFFDNFHFHFPTFKTINLSFFSFLF